jgi:hypothetical protein
MRIVRLLPLLLAGACAGGPIHVRPVPAEIPANLPACEAAPVDTASWVRQSATRIQISALLPGDMRNLRVVRDRGWQGEVWADAKNLHFSVVHDRHSTGEDRLRWAPRGEDPVDCVMTIDGAPARVRGAWVPSDVVRPHDELTAMWRDARGDLLIAHASASEPGHRAALLAMLRSVRLSGERHVRRDRDSEER